MKSLACALLFVLTSFLAHAADAPDLTTYFVVYKFSGSNCNGEGNRTISLVSGKKSIATQDDMNQLHNELLKEVSKSVTCTGGKVNAVMVTFIQRFPI